MHVNHGRGIFLILPLRNALHGRRGRLPSPGRFSQIRWRVERKYGVIGRQKQSVSVASRQIFDLRIGLTAIRLEGERKRGVAGLDSTLRRRRHGMKKGSRACNAGLSTW